MAKEFYRRLHEYYERVAEVLRGQANSASIFPNSTDIGQSRKKIYADFLEQHAPSKCNVFLGGFLFHEDGSESKQLDVIITCDTTPRFDLHNSDGAGKSFSPVEGTLGIASIKSYLDKAQLIDALEGFASISPTQSLERRIPANLSIKRYDDWPYKILYSTDGLRGETLLAHLNEFYEHRPDIPASRRPQLIHVAGKYLIVRVVPGMAVRDFATEKDSELAEGTFYLMQNKPDIQAIVWALDGLQTRATAATHINFNYGFIINNVAEIP